MTELRQNLYRWVERPKSNFAITCNFIDTSHGEVSGGPLKIGLDSSNFVSEFLGWFRFCRHLNQEFGSIRSLVIEETWIFETPYKKNQVLSTIWARIELDTWLRCLQKRNHPTNSLTKFDESSPILRGPPETSPKLARGQIQLRHNLQSRICKFWRSFRRTP